MKVLPDAQKHPVFFALTSFSRLPRFHTLQKKAPVRLIPSLGNKKAPPHQDGAFSRESKLWTLLFIDYSIL